MHEVGRSSKRVSGGWNFSVGRAGELHLRKMKHELAIFRVVLPGQPH